MATQEQIDAVRRQIERLRDQHGGDVRGVIHLINSGAMKGPAADALVSEAQGWDRALKGMFDRALAMLDTLRPDGTGR